MLGFKVLACSLLSLAAAANGTTSSPSAASISLSSTTSRSSISSSSTSGRSSTSTTSLSTAVRTSASSTSSPPGEGLATQSTTVKSVLTSSGVTSTTTSKTTVVSATAVSAPPSSSSSVQNATSTSAGTNAPLFFGQYSANSCGSAGGDAPYTLSCGELGSVITFPNGNQRKKGGIVFLVHGTGSTGEETWGPGPYNSILPNKGPGYDIAWFTSPTRSLGDAQVTAEYIAYNIKALAQQSSTGKVWIIGHSQGNINVQWALAFWPSVRQYVEGFVSLAGDFHGTAEGPLLCVGQTLLQGGCEPSVVQQSVGSKYLAAQNRAGGSALVSTTSLYTVFDDIIQPEVINPTSDLPGATVISVQQACLAYVTDHFGMTVAAPAFYLALDALQHGGQASLSRFNPSMCTFLADNPIPNPFVSVAGAIRQAALDAIAVVFFKPKVTAEPLLMPYVCQKGAASSYCAK